jgi:hypothetical protein
MAIKDFSAATRLRNDSDHLYIHNYRYNMGKKVADFKNRRGAAVLRPYIDYA